MRQSTKRLTSSILALLLLVGAFVVFVDFIQPAYREALGLRGEQLSRMNFVETQEQVISQVKALIDAYRGDEQVREIVSLALPLGPQTAQALAHLNGLAEASAVVPQSFGVSTQATQPAALGAASELVKPLATLSVRGRLIGTYEDVKTFLRGLETNIRLFDVKSLAIQPVGKSNQDLYIYDIVVAAYYQEAL